MFGRIRKEKKEERRLAKKKTREAKVNARKKSGEGTMYYNMRMPDGSVKKVKAYKSKIKTTVKPVDGTKSKSSRR